MENFQIGKIARFERNAYTQDPSEECNFLYISATQCSEREAEDTLYARGRLRKGCSAVSLSFIIRDIVSVVDLV